MQTEHALLALRFALLRVSDVSEAILAFDTANGVTARISSALASALATATASLSDARARMRSVPSVSDLLSGGAAPDSPAPTLSNRSSRNLSAAFESMQAVRGALVAAAQVRGWAWRLGEHAGRAREALVAAAQALPGCSQGCVRPLPSLYSAARLGAGGQRPVVRRRQRHRGRHLLRHGGAWTGPGCRAVVVDPRGRWRAARSSGSGRVPVAGSRGTPGMQGWAAGVRLVTRTVFSP